MYTRTDATETLTGPSSKCTRTDAAMSTHASETLTGPSSPTHEQMQQKLLQAQVPNVHKQMQQPILRNSYRPRSSTNSLPPVPPVPFTARLVRHAVTAWHPGLARFVSKVQLAMRVLSLGLPPGKDVSGLALVFQVPRRRHVEAPESDFFTLGGGSPVQNELRSSATRGPADRSPPSSTVHICTPQPWSARGLSGCTCRLARTEVRHRLRRARLCT
jgi:hypothetical protein